MWTRWDNGKIVTVVQVFIFKWRFLASSVVVAKTPYYYEEGRHEGGGIIVNQHLNGPSSKQWFPWLLSILNVFYQGWWKLFKVWNWCKVLAVVRIVFKPTEIKKETKYSADHTVRSLKQSVKDYLNTHNTREFQQ